jgi:hypothetical protein
MSVTVNKNSYQELIKQDIDRIKAEMSPSPEREHIISILIWSISQIYEEPKQLTKREFIRQIKESEITVELMKQSSGYDLNRVNKLKKH